MKHLSSTLATWGAVTMKFQVNMLNAVIDRFVRDVFITPVDKEHFPRLFAYVPLSKFLFEIGIQELAAESDPEESMTRRIQRRIPDRPSTATVGRT